MQTSMAQAKILLMYMSLSSGAQLDQIRMLVNRFSMKVCFAVAFCALTVVRVSAQQPSKPSGGSIIQGRVIYSDTGRPLRRAEISLVTQDQTKPGRLRYKLQQN